MNGMRRNGRHEADQGKHRQDPAENRTSRQVIVGMLLAVLSGALCPVNAASASGQLWPSPYDDNFIRYVYIYDYKGVEYSTLGAACDVARTSIQGGIHASYPGDATYTLVMRPYPAPSLSVSLSDQYALYNCQALFQLKFWDQSVQDFEFNDQVGRRIKTCRVGQRLTVNKELCERLERVPHSIQQKLAGY